MSAPQFTPGPWFYGDEDEAIVGVEYVQVHAGQYGEPSFRSVASVEAAFNPETGRWHPLDDETRANANLIAAAPKMYEALDALLDEIDTTLSWDDEPTASWDDRVAKARAALAKARGEQS